MSSDCGVMSSRAALCQRLPGWRAPGSLQPGGPGQAPSRRPGAARSRSGRRATRRRSEPDHARLALRPERDSPLGGRRDGAYPLAPPAPLVPVKHRRSSRRPARPARAPSSVATRVGPSDAGWAPRAAARRAGTGRRPHAPRERSRLHQIQGPARRRRRRLEQVWKV